MEGILLYKNYKVLISNFFSLVILQGANFLLPLISIPYLIKILGVETFGLLSFATAMNTYFMILSDYGFNLTATREISIHRDSNDKVIEIFSSIMTIKILLMLLGLLLLSMLVFSFDRLHKDWEIFFLTFGMVLGQVLFPVWFFQGMEKMKYISILNILAKSIFLIMIFIFVDKKEDYYLVPLFNSLGFIISGLIALYYIKNKFHIIFKFQSFEILKFYIIDGWYIFISRIAVVLYTSSNIFILGLFTNNTLVGYYSIAEKVISAISALGAIINRVLFPYLSKIWTINKVDYYNKFYRILAGIIISMFLISIIIYFLAPLIIVLLSGVEIKESIKILQLLSVTIILFPLGGLFTQSFVTQKANIFVTKATLYTSIINMILVFILIPLYGINGLAIAVILVQFFQVIINTIYFNKLKGIS
jgi:PST family polysaccharide transporter